jgi:MraZ protein
MAEDASQTVVMRAPNGASAAKVDAAGRIKLPVKFQEYLAQLPDKSMFATWNGEDMAKIYVNGFWEKTKAKLSAASKHREVARAILRLSNSFGSDVSVDSNGRVTLPQELRGKMQFKETPVQLLFVGDVIHIYRAENMAAQLAADERLVMQSAMALEELDVQ